LTRLSTNTLVAISLVLLALALLVLSIAGFLEPVQSQLLRPIAGIQSWVSLRAYAIRDLLAAPRDLNALQERISILESENARLQQQIIRLQEQAAEAEILSALLNYARSAPESRYVAANVIGRDPSPFIKTLLISVGTDHGVTHGMPVVTDRGLVGRVVAVRDTVATVQLITDPESAVNVKLQASRTDGVLAARPNGDLWIDLIDQEATIDQGELVLTSGLGGGYPSDIPVGQIVSVRKRDFELFQQAVIQPTVLFDELELVLVITNFRPILLDDSGG
jgi:rod shape-determining protein MreC